MRTSVLLSVAAVLLGQQVIGGLVSEISDGQPQAPTLVSHISSGQPQATTSQALVSQITDGQPQAPVTTPATATTSGLVTKPQAPATTPVATTPAATTSVLATQSSNHQPSSAVPAVSSSRSPAFTSAGGRSSPFTGAVVAMIGLSAVVAMLL